MRTKVLAVELLKESEAVRRLALPPNFILLPRILPAMQANLLLNEMNVYYFKCGLQCIDEGVNVDPHT